MSDVRSLLRAHRAANRIEHPHAAYSDAGKLLCKLCHEAIKSETLWDAHVRSAEHRRKLAAVQPERPTGENTNKRKHDDVEEDQGMLDVPDDADSEVRKKRSKTDIVGPTPSRSAGFPVGVTSGSNGNGNGNATPVPTSGAEKEKTATPPSLTRRKSTPAQGVEIQIPSRPATPLVGEVSSSSTPRPMAKSPLISGSDVSTPNGAGAGPTGGALAVPKAGRPSATAPTVDEEEWAAFEAEIAVEEAPHAPGLSTYADATISAPAMSTADAQAKSLEDENERKKLALDALLDDEREDATRALEDEFDEMEELEGRVRKLKERREELRKGSIANLRARAESLDKNKKQQPEGKGNAAANGDEDDESEEEEDWDDAFRFHA